LARPIEIGEVATKVGTEEKEMTTAKIIARLVSEGHEDLAEELLADSGRAESAMHGQVMGFGPGGDPECIFDPWKSYLQIGMGGEWWNGKVKMGKNVLHHKKEKVDPAYKPVGVHIDDVGHGIRFAVGGGLGFGHTFVLNFKA
jgi:hypothetical protein